MSDSSPEGEERAEERLNDSQFDFEEVGISELMYSTVLDYLRELEFVDELYHSLTLNEVSLCLSKGFEGKVSDSDIPEGLTIRSVRPWHSETETDPRLGVFLDSGKLLADEQESDIFDGEYSEESIAALSVEIGLFDETSNTRVESKEEESVVVADLSQNISSTDIFNDTLTQLYHCISSVRVDGRNIVEIEFGFSERGVWDSDLYQEFQESKIRNMKNRFVDDSGVVELPCSDEHLSDKHLSEPSIFMIQDVRQSSISEFPVCEVSRWDCYKISVDNTENVFLTVDDWPANLEPVTHEDGSVSTAISRGYSCPECNLVYLFVDVDEVGERLIPSSMTELETSSVSIGEETYEFSHFPFPENSY